MSDTTPYRRFLLTFLGTVVLLLGTAAAFNFVVDPFQFFRKPFLHRPAYFPGFQRYQNVGLARNYRYDTVIIGSSVTENFYPSDVNRALHVNALKLSISGSTAHEEALILTQAISNGQVKNVLWAIEPSAFSFGPKGVRDDQAPFPYYMYRWPSALNVEYLLAFETIRNALVVLKGHGEHDLETLETWDRRLAFPPLMSSEPGTAAVNTSRESSLPPPSSRGHPACAPWNRASRTISSGSSAQIQA